MLATRWIVRTAAAVIGFALSTALARADWLAELPPTTVVVGVVRDVMDDPSATNPKLAKDESLLATRLAGTFEMLRWFIESEAQKERLISDVRKKAMLERLIEYRRAELTIAGGVGSLRGVLREYCDRHVAMYQGRFLYATRQECQQQRFAMDSRTMSWSAEWRKVIFPRLFCDLGTNYNNRLQAFISWTGSNPKVDPFGARGPILQPRHVPSNPGVCGEFGGDSDADGLCDHWEIRRGASNGNALSRCKQLISATGTCTDNDLPVARPHGWPRGTSYTASIQETGRQGRAKPADHCREVDNRGACWTWTEVEFTIVKRGDPRSGESFWGWKFNPGTFRFDGKVPASCQDFDPRFNCHGLSLAQGRYWLDNDQTRKILARWCNVVTGPHRRGDIAVHAKVEESPPPEGWNAIAHALLLRKPGNELVFHHSRTVEINGMEFDEKLGILRYGSLPTWLDISKERWPHIPPRYYRCGF